MLDTVQGTRDAEALARWRAATVAQEAARVRMARRVAEEKQWREMRRG